MRDEIFNACKEQRRLLDNGSYKSAKVVSNEKIVDRIYKMIVETEIKRSNSTRTVFMLKCWQAEPVLETYQYI